MSQFYDRKYVEIIRQALWSGSKNLIPDPDEGTVGRAAVMIGSGFSLNAKPVHEHAKKFPLWRDLVNVMVEKLMPEPDFSAKDRQRRLDTSVAISGALRLAEEFESAFGRIKLDELLLNAIPDSEIEPSYLHKLLLSLPWADVLTTNYDTLLERDAPLIYDTVIQAEDIPLTTRPRIIKLHGSFPSGRPFIFTEEDFRTYPRKFAPFINLAQQIMLENIVCLLGFSGDDPNFLHWSGWVRDHLGSAAPRIYLVGSMNASDSQRKMMERRNVTAIDLAPLFPTSDFPDPSERHRLAIEWFLLCLEAGKPSDPENWPMASPPLLTPPSDKHMPDRFEPKARYTINEPSRPDL
jgi:hypothetical protein